MSELCGLIGVSTRSSRACRARPASSWSIVSGVPMRRRRPRAPVQTELGSLGDDIWCALASHLDLSSLHALLCCSRAICKRIRALLPMLIRAAAPSHDDRQQAVYMAIHRQDPTLANFALFAPTLIAPDLFRLLPADDAHPLFNVCADADLSTLLTLPLLRTLLRAYLSSGGALINVIEPSRLARCRNDVVVKDIVDYAAQHRKTLGIDRRLQRLVLSLAYSSRTHLVRSIIFTHPWLASARSTRRNCEDCKGLHGLLHAAAETGCSDMVRDTLTAYQKHTLLSTGISSVLSEVTLGTELVRLRDCNCESPLGVAVRCRRSRAAQELVRCGAEVGDLVGCAARGGGRLNATQVWYKRELDVD